jgi:subtilase family serine protease
MIQRSSMKVSVAVAAALAASTCGLGASALAAAQTVRLAADQGPIANGQQSITVFLKLHNEAEFDREVAALYDPASPTFRKWFTDADFAKFAPTAAEVQTVKAELEKQGLTVTSVDPQNFSVRARGDGATIAAAFGTELHTFSYKGTSFQAPTKPAQLSGAAGALVDSTLGLERHTVRPQLTIARNPLTGQPIFQQQITATQTATGIFSHITGTALLPPTSVKFKPLGTNPLPYALYSGTPYGMERLIYVSYTPAQLQAHYQLEPLIASGYDGTGQKIALLEAYGYGAEQADANVAAAAFGLPTLTSENFKIVNPEGQPLNPSAADLTGWTTEIALDIQSAHAIAPGAKLVVVNSSGQDDEDMLASAQYIIGHKLANIVSCSWEADAEIVTGVDQEKAYNSVMKRAAAAGIAFNFASGDSGDQGLGTPLGAPSVPSNSPYVTAIGGTSVLNNPFAGEEIGGNDIVTGWGSNIELLYALVDVFDPPEFESFVGGAGGGESQYYARPSWQTNVPGTGRQVPDVSADADPFTGVPVVVTSGGVQAVDAQVGGTSLATPIFSAIWAIAGQYNGAPLGQAAPAIARLKKGEITDVVDTSVLSLNYNLAGTIYDLDGTVDTYNAVELFANSTPAIAQTNFLATYTGLNGIDGPAVAFALSFGADSSLTVGPGWDNVTGYGEPNGFPFVAGVTKKN